MERQRKHHGLRECKEGSSENTARNFAAQRLAQRPEIADTCHGINARIFALGPSWTTTFSS
jgi:hypothetical protein